MSALALTSKLRDLNREYTEVLVTARILRDVGIPLSSILDDELDRLHQSCASARESYLDARAGTDRQLRAELDSHLVDALVRHRRQLLREHFISLLAGLDERGAG